MVKKEIEELKYNLKQLYDTSLELHTNLLKEIKNLKKQSKARRNWEYTTYYYIKSCCYERKSQYKILYKTVCELEKIINNKY